MLTIPTVDDVSLAFGSTDHMPKYESIPDKFKDWNNEHARAASSWFFKGAKRHAKGIEIDGKVYVAKEGVDATKALRAIRAVLCSFSPKHEHKTAACGYMLAEWFSVAGND